MGYVESNAHVVAAQMRARGAVAGKAAYAVGRRYGQLLQARVRANLSGRSGVIWAPPGGGPAGQIGPRVQTGDLRRSAHLRVSMGPAGLDVRVGTNEVQARRLELGFVGADSLGRVYDQAPLPAFRPAGHALARRYQRALGEATVGALRGA